MGKGEKTGLGRALVKHHNQMVQLSKEKGRFYRNQHKKVLESVTEVNDIDAVIDQADEAHRLFSGIHPPASILINLDPGSSEVTDEKRRELQKREEELHASSLRVPRRPPWNSKMSVEELDNNERQAFLIWRRSLARLEENENLVLTPFEKNLDIWRQLWRVVERSDLLVMVVDARDPLFYRCPDLEEYAREVDEHKKTMLLVNKADLLPLSIRKKWAEYFHLHGILYVFWSAKAASEDLERKELGTSEIQDNVHESSDDKTRIYGREELLSRLLSEAEDIALTRKILKPIHPTTSTRNAETRGVMVGFVGYPNVGKSSTINALVGAKRAGVTSTPGKTKHFQTLIISEKLTLCDCPGLVFPSFTSSRYEMIASGVLPIDRMTEHRHAVQVVANRVPRKVIEDVYKISLPKPKPYEPQSRPPLASELLRVYCASRNYVSSSGLPDETKAARQILKDFVNGKLPHYELPPDVGDGCSGGGTDAHHNVDNPNDDNDGGTSLSDDDSSGIDEQPLGSELEDAPSLDHVLNDLNAFDMANGIAPRNAATANKKKSSKAPHKQHKKPQRKKDRTWRVSNDGGDGMPSVKVFQKPINTGPVKI
ncbi:unnamed protein product [Cuscuta campestris]|uniref:CP-type G domain-containing protein n=1 Tax=Cuscuta campestris TaxID=132261 RepID=A0A484N606_9ASTE|nr:unnamed protein product [Cuscuta campestris]